MDRTVRTALYEDRQVVVDEKGVTREYPVEAVICLPHGLQGKCPECSETVPPKLCPQCQEPVEVLERNEIRSSLDDWLYEEADVFILCPRGHERKVVERFDGER